LTWKKFSSYLKPQAPDNPMMGETLSGYHINWILIVNGQSVYRYPEQKSSLINKCYRIISNFVIFAVPGETGFSFAKASENTVG